MKIAFVWQGVSGRYGQWKDGLWKAMQIIGKQHEVRLFEPTGDIEGFAPDWVLYWEAPCTYKGKDSENYKRICALPFKKALLFAGGQIEPMWVKDFDHIFVESQIDADTCERLELPYSKAFGYNDDIFKPAKSPKIWKGMHHATCASWKRTWLMTEVLKEKSLVCGRYQETDPKCWMKAAEHNALILPEQSAESIAALLNASEWLVQTSEFWGGGQRATLEAMACGTPVIAMSDSPKNCEFIRETGFGVICDPNPDSIRAALETPRNFKTPDLSRWTGEEYAAAILKYLV